MKLVSFYGYFPSPTILNLDIQIETDGMINTQHLYCVKDLRRITVTPNYVHYLDYFENQFESTYVVNKSIFLLGTISIRNYVWTLDEME